MSTNDLACNSAKFPKASAQISLLQSSLSCCCLAPSLVYYTRRSISFLVYDSSFWFVLPILTAMLSQNDHPTLFLSCLMLAVCYSPEQEMSQCQNVPLPHVPISLPLTSSDPPISAFSTCSDPPTSLQTSVQDQSMGLDIPIPTLLTIRTQVKPSL